MTWVLKMILMKRRMRSRRPFLNVGLPTPTSLLIALDARLSSNLGMLNTHQV